MAVFLPGFCLAQSAVTADICCVNPDCASDSFAEETADRELSKPPFPHPPLCWDTLDIKKLWCFSTSVRNMGDLGLGIERIKLVLTLEITSCQCRYVITRSNFSLNSSSLLFLVLFSVSCAL